jgi:hypothetical protein
VGFVLFNAGNAPPRIWSARKQTSSDGQARRFIGGLHLLVKFSCGVFQGDLKFSGGVNACDSVQRPTPQWAPSPSYFGSKFVIAAAFFCDVGEHRTPGLNARVEVKSAMQIHSQQRTVLHWAGGSQAKPTGRRTRQPQPMWECTTTKCHCGPKTPRRTC